MNLAKCWNACFMISQSGRELFFKNLVAWWNANRSSKTLIDLDVCKKRPPCPLTMQLGQQKWYQPRIPLWRTAKKLSKELRERGMTDPSEKLKMVPLVNKKEVERWAYFVQQAKYKDPAWSGEQNLSKLSHSQTATETEVAKTSTHRFNQHQSSHSKFIKIAKQKTNPTPCESLRFKILVQFNLISHLSNAILEWAAKNVVVIKLPIRSTWTHPRFLFWLTNNQTSFNSTLLNAMLHSQKRWTHSP